MRSFSNVRQGMPALHFLDKPILFMVSCLFVLPIFGSWFLKIHVTRYSDLPLSYSVFAGFWFQSEVSSDRETTEYSLYPDFELLLD